MQTTWMRRGTVSGRVALLLRSAEIQPPSHDLFDWFLPRNPIPLYSFAAGRLQGHPAGMHRRLQVPRCRPACKHTGPSRAFRSPHWQSSALPVPLLACLSGGEKGAGCTAPWLQVRFVTAPRPCNGLAPESSPGLRARCTPALATLVHKQCAQGNCCSPARQPPEKRQAAFIDCSAVCLTFNQSVV